jgi:hypothetical protein
LLHVQETERDIGVGGGIRRGICDRDLGHGDLLLAQPINSSISVISIDNCDLASFFNPIAAPGSIKKAPSIVSNFKPRTSRPASCSTAMSYLALCPTLAIFPFSKIGLSACTIFSRGLLPDRVADRGSFALRTLSECRRVQPAADRFPSFPYRRDELSFFNSPTSSRSSGQRPTVAVVMEGRRYSRWLLLPVGRRLRFAKHGDLLHLRSRGALGFASPAGGAHRFEFSSSNSASTARGCKCGAVPRHVERHPYEW